MLFRSVCFANAALSALAHTGLLAQVAEWKAEASALPSDTVASNAPATVTPQASHTTAMSPPPASTLSDASANTQAAPAFPGNQLTGAPPTGADLRPSRFFLLQLYPLETLKRERLAFHDGRPDVSRLMRLFPLMKGAYPRAGIGVSVEFDALAALEQALAFVQRGESGSPFPFYAKCPHIDPLLGGLMPSERVREVQFHGVAAAGPRAAEETVLSAIERAKPDLTGSRMRWVEDVHAVNTQSRGYVVFVTIGVGVGISIEWMVRNFHNKQLRHGTRVVVAATTGQLQFCFKCRKHGSHTAQSCGRFGVRLVSTLHPFSSTWLDKLVTSLGANSGFSGDVGPGNDEPRKWGHLRFDSGELLDKALPALNRLFELKILAERPVPYKDGAPKSCHRCGAVHNPLSSIAAHTSYNCPLKTGRVTMQDADGFLRVTHRGAAATADGVEDMAITSPNPFAALAVGDDSAPLARTSSRRPMTLKRSHSASRVQGAESRNDSRKPAKQAKTLRGARSPPVIVGKPPTRAKTAAPASQSRDATAPAAPSKATPQPRKVQPRHSAASPSRAPIAATIPAPANTAPQPCKTHARPPAAPPSRALIDNDAWFRELVAASAAAPAVLAPMLPRYANSTASFAETVRAWRQGAVSSAAPGLATPSSTPAPVTVSAAPDAASPPTAAPDNPVVPPHSSDQAVADTAAGTAAASPSVGQATSAVSDNRTTSPATADPSTATAPGGSAPAASANTPTLPQNHALHAAEVSAIPPAGAARLIAPTLPDAKPPGATLGPARSVFAIDAPTSGRRCVTRGCLEAAEEEVSGLCARCRALRAAGPAVVQIAQPDSPMSPPGPRPAYQQVRFADSKFEDDVNPRLVRVQSLAANDSHIVSGHFVGSPSPILMSDRAIVVLGDAHLVPAAAAPVPAAAPLVPPPAAQGAAPGPAPGLCSPTVPNGSFAHITSA